MLEPQTEGDVLHPLSRAEGSSAMARRSSASGALRSVRQVTPDNPCRAPRIER